MFRYCIAWQESSPCGHTHGELHTIERGKELIEEWCAHDGYTVNDEGTASVETDICGSACHYLEIFEVPQSVAGAIEGLLRK